MEFIPAFLAVFFLVAMIGKFQQDKAQRQRDIEASQEWARMEKEAQRKAQEVLKWREENPQWEDPEWQREYFKKKPDNGNEAS
jgi:hypothetical protein